MSILNVTLLKFVEIILNVENFFFFSYKNLKGINIIKINLKTILIYIYTKKISETNF